MTILFFKLTFTFAVLVALTLFVDGLVDGRKAKECVAIVGVTLVFATVISFVIAILSLIWS